MYDLQVRKLWENLSFAIVCVVWMCEQPVPGLKVATHTVSLLRPVFMFKGGSTEFKKLSQNVFLSQKKKKCTFWANFISQAYVSNHNSAIYTKKAMMFSCKLSLLDILYMLSTQKYKSFQAWLHCRRNKHDPQSKNDIFVLTKLARVRTTKLGY